MLITLGQEYPDTVSQSMYTLFIAIYLSLLWRIGMDYTETTDGTTTAVIGNNFIPSLRRILAERSHIFITCRYQSHRGIRHKRPTRTTVDLHLPIVHVPNRIPFHHFPVCLLVQAA